MPSQRGPNKQFTRATLEQGEGNRRGSGRPEGMNLRIVTNISAVITMVTGALFPNTVGKCYSQKYAVWCNQTEGGLIQGGMNATTIHFLCMFLSDYHMVTATGAPP